MEKDAGTVMQEFREQTVNSHIASVMHSDRANENGVQGISGSARYSRLPRVLSNSIPTVSIRIQMSLVLMIWLMLFLSFLWMFQRPN